jgi:hypothetical protein
VQPAAEQLELPPSYGSPNRLLDWTSVEQRLAESRHYWIATVRRNGAPHVVPVDGMWLDGACYFGGDPATVHIQNLRRDSRIALHLEDGESAVIVEGIASWTTPSKTDAQRLAVAAKAKYGLRAVGKLIPSRGMEAGSGQGYCLDPALLGCDPLPLRSRDRLRPRTAGMCLGPRRRSRLCNLDSRLEDV